MEAVNKLTETQRASLHKVSDAMFKENSQSPVSNVFQYNCFMKGANEILSNPEKYGLIQSANDN